ncbi:MAG: serine/threonine-protein kinase [Terriglobales bacterium]
MAASDPYLGATIGRYRVTSRLGSGGMGVVYKAEDRDLGRPVALKFLPADAQGLALERFRREARAASAVNHPNICAIYEIGQHEGRPFIAMEFLEGETLQQRLTRGPLPPEQAQRLGAEIAGALEAAHAHGVVHRDLKPANLFVTRLGPAKILDFGLARAQSEGADADTALTLPGMPLGTIAYMSPEQARGEELDTRTDLFSFGAVLYEMAAGAPAFPGNAAAVRFDAILNRPPAPLPSGVPPEFARVLSKALQKDRALRYQSAAAMKADLLGLRQSRPPAPPHRSRWPVYTAVAVVIAAALAYRFLRPAPRLTAQDTLVLADFNNTTGDPVFNGALRQGLEAQLAQSPFLKLVSDERIAQTLALMDRLPNSVLTPALAREVCQRTSSTAAIDGSITQLGNEYVLGLTATGCAEGDALAEVQTSAADKDKILPALGAAAARLRTKLGESHASVLQFDAIPEDVTTSSLEALQAYSLGWHTVDVDNNFAAAIPLFQKAAALDPNFAMAYAQIAASEGPLSQHGLAAAAIRKAYALRAHASEAEKLFIAANYDIYATGDLAQARADCGLWARVYPRNEEAWVYLWITDFFMGDYPRALADAETAVRLGPGSSNNVVNLAFSQLWLNDLAGAHATVAAARARKLNSPWYPLVLYQVAFLRHDAAGMAQAAAQAPANGAMNDAMLFLQSQAAAFAGHMAQASALATQAATAARVAGEPQAAAEYAARDAVRQALVGNRTLALREAAPALAAKGDPQVLALAGLALALAGDAARAGQAARALARQYPDDTIVRTEFVPLIQAAEALARGDGPDAEQALAPTTPYELGEQNGGLTFALFPVFLHGCADLLAERGAAAPEFQKILDHSGVVADQPIAALAHLGLARAAALTGNRTQARSQYQQFLALWSHADATLPLLQSAKAEYARLETP